MHTAGPTLTTPRLLLRPMRADDADALLGIFGDPQVMAAFDVAPFDRAQMDAWVRRNLDHQERHGHGLYAVILRETGRLVGDCGLEYLDEGDAREAELGYDFRRDHWGRGLATEAATAVRDHAFGPLGLPRLISLIRAGNAPSRRVAEKIGMRLDVTLARGGHPYWRFALDRP